MTIADDMRSASMGELARTRAQLKTANDEIEQLRRQLVQADQRASADLDVLSSIQYELDQMTDRCKRWIGVAMRYRMKLIGVTGPYTYKQGLREWSRKRRASRANPSKEVTA